MKTQRWFVAVLILLLPLFLQGCYSEPSATPDPAKMTESQKVQRKEKSGD